ncbi:hypothetical protein Hanom_Chr16g01506621 [Helianthus anomalus]
MKKWYDSRNTSVVDGFNSIKDAFELSRKRVNILWPDRCKEQEIQRTRDHDREALGNPGGLKHELEKLESGHTGERSTVGENVVLSSADIALHVCPHVTHEDLEEGEFVSELSDEQILALTNMKVVDDATIDETPNEPEVANLDGLDEIVFEGDAKKSKYVREDGT